MDETGAYFKVLKLHFRIVSLRVGSNARTWSESASPAREKKKKNYILKLEMFYIMKIYNNMMKNSCRSFRLSMFTLYRSYFIILDREIEIFIFSETFEIKLQA